MKICVSISPTVCIESARNSIHPKQTTWNEYDSTGQTLGEAFDKNFDNTSWKEFEKEGKKYIRFSGFIDLGEMGESLLELEFSARKTGDGYYFLVEEGYANGEPLSSGEISIVMQYGFNGDIEELFASLFLNNLFG